MQKISGDEEKARRSPTCLVWSSPEGAPSESSTWDRQVSCDRLEALRKKERLRNMQEHQEIQCLQAQQERKQAFSERLKALPTSRKQRSPEKHRRCSKSPPQRKESREFHEMKKPLLPPLKRPEQMVIAGNLSDPPVVNAWEEQRRMQSALCELTPATQDDEISMVVKALEISKLDTGQSVVLQNENGDDDDAVLKEATEKSKEGFGPSSRCPLLSDRPLANHRTVNTTMPHNSDDTVFGSRHIDHGYHVSGPTRRGGFRRIGRGRSYHGGRCMERGVSPNNGMTHVKTGYLASREQWQQVGQAAPLQRYPSSNSSRGGRSAYYTRTILDTDGDWSEVLKAKEKPPEISTSCSTFKPRRGEGFEFGDLWKEKMGHTGQLMEQEEEEINELQVPSVRTKPQQIKIGAERWPPGHQRLAQESKANVPVNKTGNTLNNETSAKEVDALNAASLLLGDSETEQAASHQGSTEVPEVPFDVWLAMCDKYLPLLTKGMAHLRKSLGTYHNLGGAQTSNSSTTGTVESPQVFPFFHPPGVTSSLDIAQLPPHHLMAAFISKEQQLQSGNSQEKGYTQMASSVPNSVEGYPIVQPMHHLGATYLPSYQMTPIEPQHIPQCLPQGMQATSMNHIIQKGQPQVTTHLHPRHYSMPQVNSSVLALPPSSSRIVASVPKSSVYVSPHPQYFNSITSSHESEIPPIPNPSPSEAVPIAAKSKLNPQAQSFDCPSTVANGFFVGPFPTQGFKQPNFGVQNSVTHQEGVYGPPVAVFPGKSRRNNSQTIGFPGLGRASSHLQQDSHRRAAQQ